jgi:hypothetical protein
VSAIFQVSTERYIPMGCSDAKLGIVYDNQKISKKADDKKLPSAFLNSVIAAHAAIP